mgnify:CR=1 FL=1
MADVVHITGKKLFTAKENKYLAVLSSSDSSPITKHVMFIVCSTCEQKGKVLFEKSPNHPMWCPDCHGFGVLLRILRPDEVDKTTPKPVESPNPTLR